MSVIIASAFFALGLPLVLLQRRFWASGGVRLRLPLHSRMLTTV